MFTTLLSIGAIIILLSLILSLIAITRQQKKVIDKGIDVATKHPVIANPIFIAYLLFPIAILIGVAVWYYYQK